jgi:dCMP deaminase
MKEKMKLAHMMVATVYSQLSTARRLKVGAIIVQDDRVISIGYNGTAPGCDNNCEIEPEGWDGDISKLKTKPDVIHAEDNALRKVGGMAIQCTMFVTHAPCVPCAKKIVESGLNKVIFKEEYRDSLGIDYLNKHGIETEQWLPTNT